MRFSIRRATADDKQAWLHMRQGLWPEAPLDYLSLDLDRMLGDERKAVFVAANAEGDLAAFIEVGLRDVAEGCETSPVGYIEAWYVDPHVRGQKLGREMMLAAEQWAREKGMSEMASDTWIDNDSGIQVHQRLGYYEVDRLVHFAKRL